jgi:hypothetical protein
MSCHGELDEYCWSDCAKVSSPICKTHASSLEIPAGAPTINPLWEQGKIFIFMFYIYLEVFFVVSLPLPPILTSLSLVTSSLAEAISRSPEEWMHSLNKQDRLLIGIQLNFSNTTRPRLSTPVECGLRSQGTNKSSVSLPTFWSK